MCRQAGGGEGGPAREEEGGEEDHWKADDGESGALTLGGDPDDPAGGDPFTTNLTSLYVCLN